MVSKKYNVQIGEYSGSNLSMRETIYRMVHGLHSKGIHPDVIAEKVSRRIIRRVGAMHQIEDVQFQKKWFCGKDRLLRFEDDVYVVSCDWGKQTTPGTIASLLAAFPNLGIRVTSSNESGE